ncbi:hypothetical protein [Streptomyces vastus]|uniref:Uncharacterized protein n=1 Tax=Streptomyces vastus TaxID=285451 RepID=A0ABP6E9A1_9ACTN
MPGTSKSDPAKPEEKPEEAGWRKIRLIASAFAALSAAAYHCGRLLIWLRNLL